MQGPFRPCHIMSDVALARLIGLLKQLQQTVPQDLKKNFSLEQSCIHCTHHPVSVHATGHLDAHITMHMHLL